MPKFEQPQPYSPEEQTEVKEEMERQADEQRKTSEQQPSAEETLKPQEEGGKEPLVEELELGIREEKQSIEAGEQERRQEEEVRKVKEKEKQNVLHELKEEPAPEVIESVHRAERKSEVIKTPEQILIEARENFARAQLDKVETLKTVKKFKGESLINAIKSSDSETIAEYDEQTKNLVDKGIPATLMTAEEKQVYYDAQTRRDAFISHIESCGIKNVQACKMYEDIIEHNRAKEQYQDALKNTRATMYEKALDEIEKLGVPKEKANELMRQKIDEIAKTTVVAEANNLYGTKTKIGLEAKGDASFFEKSWKTAGKAVEWYRKLPLKYKLMVSAGLLAGGVAAGAAGGATGAALAAGVVTGRWFQRSFGGAATAVGLESLIKRSQEKRAEKKTFKEFGDKLSEIIENNDKSLDERLFELEGKKKGEKTSRYILAGTAGAVVASGLLGRAIRWGLEETGIGKSVKESVTGWFEHKPPSPELAVSHGPGYIPTAEDQEIFKEKPILLYGESYEVLRGGPQIAEKGDSVWKIIGRQMSERYGEKFDNLDEARKTYLIDALKDRVAVDPEKFGITNVDQIEAGKTYNLLPGSRIEIEELMDKAKTLEEGIASQITEHDKMIEDWVKNHPGESLTTEKVDEILFGGKTEISDIEKYEEIASAKRAGTPIEIPGQEEAAQAEELPGEPEAEDSRFKAEYPYSPEEKRQMGERIMDYNEKAQVRAIGYAQPEYQTVRNVKVNIFLQEFPPRHRAWDMWRMNPNYSRYSPYEFRHHVRAAEIIRNYHPHNRGIGQMTIGRFFQTYGPRRFPMPFPPPPPPPFGRPF